MPPTSAIRRLGVGLVLLVACGPSTAPTPALLVSAGEVREIVAALAAVPGPEGEVLTALSWQTAA